MDGLHVTGNIFHGQLYINTTVGDNKMTPTISKDVDPNIVSTFEAMKTSSFILFKDGSVGACDRNNFGQFGDGTNEETVIEPLPNDLSIQKLGVGPRAKVRVCLLCSLVDDNGVACTTCLKDRGQLGVGANVNKNVLTLVDFDDDIEVAHVSAYGDHTLSG